jgi:hypothetical protein
VLDLHSRRLVGWAMGPSPNADLVIDALLMAFSRRRPDRRVVHHLRPRGRLHLPGPLAAPGRPRSGAVVRIDGRLLRQRTRRGVLRNPQARADLDPRRSVLADQGPAALGPVRLHRGLLQPRRGSGNASATAARLTTTRSSGHGIQAAAPILWQDQPATTSVGLR